VTGEHTVGRESPAPGAGVQVELATAVPILLGSLDLLRPFVKFSEQLLSPFQEIQMPIKVNSNTVKEARSLLIAVS
jgi:hypothetical protein